MPVPLSYFGGLVAMDIVKVIAELREEFENLDAAIAILEGLQQAPRVRTLNGQAKSAKKTGRPAPHAEANGAEPPASA